MKRKYAETLESIFQKPVPANIAWRDIEILFAALGGVIDPGKGSRVIVTLNNEVAVFHRPHPQKEANKGAFKAAKDFLIICGVKPC